MSAWQLPLSTAKLTPSSASTPGKRLVNWLNSRKGIALLLGQPLVPILRESLEVVLRDGNQFADVLHRGGILFEVDLVNQELDGAMAPLVTLLGQQHLDVAAAQVAQLLRQRIHRDAFHQAGGPFERVVGEQRPAANHRPAT